MAEAGSVHVVIPDTQVKPGVPTDHLAWAMRYVVDEFAGKPNVKVVHLGDHADMPSLSSYDKGKLAMEGRRVVADIDAANAGFDVLNKPLTDYNARRKQYRERQWWPHRVILHGNHEWRIQRAVEDCPQLEGFLSMDSLNYAASGWDVHEFLAPVFLDGVGYSHYWPNPMTGRPYGGSIQLRLKNLGHSFTMGHVQGFAYDHRWARGHDGVARGQHGLVAGSFYQHDEDYKGPANDLHWRGIVVKRRVFEGDYDLETISMAQLRDRYA